MQRKGGEWRRDVNFSMQWPSARRDWLLVRTRRAMRRILGSNERLNFAVIGLNSRAYAHLASLKANKKRCPHRVRLRRGQRHSAEVRG